MAISNSYREDAPKDFHFLKAIVGEAYPQTMGLGTLDSTNTVVIVITGFTQRAGTNIGDVVGTIYNTAGATGITLSSMKYSKVGASGPWTSITVLSGDGAYSLPDGDAGGDPFNIVVEMTEEYTGSLWFEMTISWNSQQDVAGPYSFAYFAPALFITSNLGWANRESMFDAALNPSLLSFKLADLATTSLSDDYVKGPYNLVFDSDGTKYLVPQSVGRVLGRRSLYLWRVSSGIISEFRFVPNAPPVEEEPAALAKVARILN